MERSQRHRSQYRRAEYHRLKKKTKQEEFVEALHREFEMSPRVSHGVLELVEGMFFDKWTVGDGQISLTAISSAEGAGKAIEEMKKVQVILTRDVLSECMETA